MKVNIMALHHFFHGKTTNSFQSQNKTDYTKLKEDQDYGSSLLCARDQQTKQGKALCRKN